LLRLPSLKILELQVDVAPVCPARIGYSPLAELPSGRGRSRRLPLFLSGVGIGVRTRREGEKHKK